MFCDISEQMATYYHVFLSNVVSERKNNVRKRSERFLINTQIFMKFGRKVTLQTAMLFIHLLNTRTITAHSAREKHQRLSI